MLEVKTPFDTMAVGAYASYTDRRNAAIRVIEGGITLSEILLADKAWRDIAIELLHGREIGPDGRAAQVVTEVSGKTFHLRTIDGRNITGEGGHFVRGLQVGTKGMDTRQIRELQRRGGDHIIRRKNESPDIHCDAELATDLLRAWGYRLREPRYWPRRIRKGERDADGNIVTQVDRWVLYEVGGPFEDEAPVRQRRKKSA